MEYIYAPWRTKYLKSKSNSCVFCHISISCDSDEKNYVFYRDEFCFGVMNTYPYTPGHFMFIPHCHTDSLEDLEKNAWFRISVLAQKGVRLLKEGYGASGVNLGMNLGENAGAGIASHIHLHLVPRFFKDTNFISVVGKTRVYPTDFNDVFQKIKELSKTYLVF